MRKLFQKSKPVKSSREPGEVPPSILSFSLIIHFHRTSPNRPFQPPSTTSSQHMALTYMPYRCPYFSSPPPRYPPLPLRTHGPHLSLHHHLNPRNRWVLYPIPIPHQSSLVMAIRSIQPPRSFPLLLAFLDLLRLSLCRPSW